MELGECQPGKDKRREGCWCRKLRRRAGGGGVTRSHQEGQRQWGPAHRGVSLDCKAADTSDKEQKLFWGPGGVWEPSVTAGS